MIITFIHAAITIRDAQYQSITQHKTIGTLFDHDGFSEPSNFCMAQNVSKYCPYTCISCRYSKIKVIFQKYSKNSTYIVNIDQVAMI